MYETKQSAYDFLSGCMKQLAKLKFHVVFYSSNDLPQGIFGWRDIQMYWRIVSFVCHHQMCIFENISEDFCLLNVMLHNE